MIPSILRNRRFLELLQRFDREIADKARAEGCPHCGGVLHSGRYRRSPRGLPPALASMQFFRESLCCSQEDCRARTTPPSVLFSGRRHYLAISHLLLSALDRKSNVRRRRRLKQELGVDRRTLERWRRWWRAAFKETAVYRSAPVLAMLSAVADLPRRLWNASSGQGLERLLDALAFLAPLASPSVELTRGQRWVAAARRVCSGPAR